MSLTNRHAQNRDINSNFFEPHLWVPSSTNSIVQSAILMMRLTTTLIFLLLLSIYTASMSFERKLNTARIWTEDDRKSLKKVLDRVKRERGSQKGLGEENQGSLVDGSNPKSTVPTSTPFRTEKEAHAEMMMNKQSSSSKPTKLAQATQKEYPNDKSYREYQGSSPSTEPFHYKQQEFHDEMLREPLADPAHEPVEAPSDSSSEVFHDEATDRGKTLNAKKQGGKFLESYDKKREYPAEKSNSPALNSENKPSTSQSSSDLSTQQGAESSTIPKQCDEEIAIHFSQFDDYMQDPKNKLFAHMFKVEGYKLMDVFLRGLRKTADLVATNETGEFEIFPFGDIHMMRYNVTHPSMPIHPHNYPTGYQYSKEHLALSNLDVAPH